jgi:hypothetical protein
VPVELTFVQLSPFVSDWRRMRLTDEDLSGLEAELLRRPNAGPVIAGTAGLRKLRFAPRSWARGKRGAARVVYGWFPDHATVYLFLLYGKNEQADLMPREKRQCRDLVAQIRRLLDHRG